MTPQSRSRRRRAPRTVARRAGVMAVAFATVGALPLSAQALGDDPSAASIARTDAVRYAPTTDAPTTDGDSAPAKKRNTPAKGAGTKASEPGPYERIAILTDSYEWDQRGRKVRPLQRVLGVEVDGWYGAETARAHRAALEFLGAPTGDLPAPEVTASPMPSGFAALRDCESGGDYSITNPSGKYRGAYQFDQSTWNSVAGRHAPRLVGADPAASAPADQDALALALYRERGASPWPHCGRHLG